MGSPSPFAEINIKKYSRIVNLLLFWIRLKIEIEQKDYYENCKKELDSTFSLH